MNNGVRNVSPSHYTEQENLLLFDEVVKRLSQTYGDTVASLISGRQKEQKLEIVQLAKNLAREEVYAHPEQYIEKHPYSVVEQFTFDLLQDQLLKLAQMREHFLQSSGVHTFYFGMLQTQEGRDKLEQKIQDLENVVTFYAKSSEFYRAKVREKFPFPHLNYKLNLAYRGVEYSDLPLLKQRKAIEEVSTKEFFGYTVRETNGVYEDDYLAVLQLLLYSLKLERDFNAKIPPVGFPKAWKNAETKVYDLQIQVRTSTLGFSVGINDVDRMRKISLQKPDEGSGVGVCLASEYHNHFRKGLPRPQKFSPITSEEFDKGVEAGIPLFLAYRSFLYYVQGLYNEQGYTVDLRSSERFPEQTEITSIFWPINMRVIQNGKKIEFILVENTPYLTPEKNMFTPRQKFFAAPSDAEKDLGPFETAYGRWLGFKQTKERNFHRREIVNNTISQIDSIFGKRKQGIFSDDEPIPLI